jgi:hypothetical protein
MYRSLGDNDLCGGRRKKRDGLVMRRSGRGKMVSEGYVEFLLSLPGARWVYFDGFINPVMEIRGK